MLANTCFFCIVFPTLEIRVCTVCQNSAKVLKLTVLWDVTLCQMLSVEEPAMPICQTEKATATLKI